jgi:anti-sigma-K factor RskA
MTRRDPEPHALIGAYAVDALDPASAGRFERHLSSCPECADELAGLRETAARLCAAAAERPPQSLRKRVLAASARSPQLPPVIGRAGRLRRPAASRRSWQSGSPSPSRRRARGRVAVAIAAASLVAAAVIIAAVVLTGPGTSASGRARGRRIGIAIAAVLTAPDAKMLDVRLHTAGRATVIMSTRENALVFTAAGLPGLPRASCYELWLIGPGRDRPAGMLPPPRHGMTGPVVASGLRTGDHLGLTVEPRGGTRRPTSALLLLVPL